MPPIDDPLVSTDWLSARIDDPKVKIIDASFKMPGVLPLPLDDYLGAHIPGAVFFDVDAIADHNDARPHMYPNAEQFARDVSALGIASGDTVVAYDSGGWVAAPRAWWMFLSFGHRNVKVLDGGLKKWLREGRPTHSGKVTPKPGKFRAKLDPSFVRSKQQLLGNLETRAEQLVDARPRSRVEATVAEPCASRDPAAWCRPPCLLALLDDIPVGLSADCLCAGNLRRRLRLDCDGWSVQRGDFGRRGVGFRQSRCARLLGPSRGSLVCQGRG